VRNINPNPNIILHLRHLPTSAWASDFCFKSTFIAKDILLLLSKVDLIIITIKKNHSMKELNGLKMEKFQGLEAYFWFGASESSTL